MASKFIILAAALACANAGLIGAPLATTYAAGPLYAQPAPALAYAAAPTSIGASHQSVVRSLGGNQAVSTYSKAVDSAFSSVRKYDTRVTNDALTVAHAPVYSTYAHAAPVAPALAVAHHAAPVLTYSPAAVVSHTVFDGIGAHYVY